MKSSKAGLIKLSVAAHDFDGEMSSPGSGCRAVQPFALMKRARQFPTVILPRYDGISHNP